MAAGWAWSYSIPLNRHVWTPSMVLWSGGISFVVVAASYLVIDVAGFVWWTFPLVVIGANSLLAYVWDHVFDRGISDILVANLARQFSEPTEELIRSIGEVGVMWLLLYYLYRNRSFLKA
jgi:predicted acyltransferase